MPCSDELQPGLSNKTLEINWKRAHYMTVQYLTDYSVQSKNRATVHHNVRSS